MEATKKQPTELFKVNTPFGTLVVAAWRGLSALCDAHRFADTEEYLRQILSGAAATWSVGYGKIGEGGSVHAFALDLSDDSYWSRQLDVPVNKCTVYDHVVALMLAEGLSASMDMWSVNDRCAEFLPHDHHPMSDGARRYCMVTENNWRAKYAASFGCGNRWILTDDTSVIRWCKEHGARAVSHT